LALFAFIFASGFGAKEKEPVRRRRRKPAKIEEEEFDDEDDDEEPRTFAVIMGFLTHQLLSAKAALWRLILALWGLIVARREERSVPLRRERVEPTLSG